MITNYLRLQFEIYKYMVCFLFHFQDELKEDESSDIDFASHGIIDPKTKISIKIDLNQDDDDIKETDDNKEILVKKNIF